MSSTPKATILVVDDRQANRAYLSALLGARGYATIEAEDGLAALELLRECRPELVLIDILMPRMDGYEFVRRVRSDPALARTPIVLLTAHYRHDQAHALTGSLGVTHIMTKPIEPEVVLAIVEQSLKANGSAASPPPTRDEKSTSALRPLSPATFKEEHRRLLTDTLAQKASQLEVANDRLRGLVNLGRRLAAERDPRRLLSLFSSAAGELVGSEYTLLAVADFQSSQAHDVASGADEERVDAPTAELHPLSAAPVIKHILASGRDPTVVGSISSASAASDLLRRFGGARSAMRVPIAAHGAGAEPATAAGAALPQQFRSLAPELIIAPIATASRQYGLIVFGGLSSERAADGSIESLSQSMGAVLAVAFENAIRYEEIEHHSRMLQQEIAERRLAEQRIARLNAELEERVAQRTAELERSHERLRQSERMASLGTLCAGLGHDMGNLLLPIRVRLDMIEDQLTEPRCDASGKGGVGSSEQETGESRATTPCSLSPVPCSAEIEGAPERESGPADLDLEEVDASPAEHVTAIRQCIGYIGDLTSGLRLLSLDPEEECNQPPVTCVQEWWAQVQPLMRSALPRRIELVASLPPAETPIVVPVARHRLTQAVFNLVQNAGDAMRLRPPAGPPSGGAVDAPGRVVVSVELREPPPESRGSEEARENSEQETGESRATSDPVPCSLSPVPWCFLSVSDDGPGMSEHVCRRAIEPFFTTKSRGLSTGLGLSLVHGIVKSVNGSLDIGSAPGKGTKVTLTLPVARHAVAAGDEAAGNEASSSASERQQVALVSVNHSRTRALCVSMLDVLGFRVRCLDVEQGSRWVDEELASIENDAVWVAQVDAAPIESIRRFIDGGRSRRVALLGEGNGCDLPGCAFLGSQPSATQLRSQLRRLFGRGARQTAAAPAGSEVA